jgi:membrane-bound hydrogenase subunit beta
MRAEAIVNSFKKRFGAKVEGARIDKREHKLKITNVIERVWFTVDRAAFRDAVSHLCRICENPHFAVASGYDKDDNIELIYHFSTNYGGDLEEVCIGIRVVLPKKNPTIPTITGLIPGALISERELQEMLGVKVRGIPDPRRMFLHKDFPEGVYPWRRDGTGPDKLVRNTHKGGRG